MPLPGWPPEHLTGHMRQRLLLTLLLGTLFTASLGGTTGIPAAAATTFTDIDGNVHAEMIEEIAALGLTNGCNEDGTLYCPAQHVTRGQMASFLARALDLPPALADHFDDDEGNIHEAPINQLYEAGVTLGFTDGTFRPSLIVSRAQMASLVARGFGEYLIPAMSDWFTDDQGNIHEDNINALAANAITYGCLPTESAFCPDQPIRRDQMASFLGRLVGRQWSFAAIDAKDGRLPSLAIGADGLPVIAYQNADGIAIAHCAVPTCDSLRITPIYDPVVDGGTVSLAILPNGNPMIAWNEGELLRAAFCFDPSCTSFEIVHKLADSLTMMTSRALAIGADGNPLVVGYVETGAAPEPPSYLTETVLSALHCHIPSCFNSSQYAIDSGGRTGLHASVAIGSDGLPLVAYQRDFGPMIHGFLRVAHCADVGCSSATVTAPANSAAAGLGTSIVMGGDGLPLISMRSWYDGNIVVVRCSDVACTSAVLAPAAYVEFGAGRTSIAVDSSGVPHVAYSGWKLGDGPFATYEPILADCTDTACSQLSLERFTDPAVEGAQISLAFDPAGRAVVTYWNQTADTLEFARSGRR